MISDIAIQFELRLPWLQLLSQAAVPNPALWRSRVVMVFRGTSNANNQRSSRVGIFVHTKTSSIQL